MNVLMYFFLFVMIFSDIVKSRKLQTSLGRLRLLAEYHDIKEEGLLLSSPFNTSRDECGIRLSPIRKDLKEWHFSFLGVNGSDYENGTYHGRIILDRKYPQVPPRVQVMTPNGRWKINTDICLSASAMHPELWDPHWNLRTLVLSLRHFMLSFPDELGSIRTSLEEKRRLALGSKNFHCPECEKKNQDRRSHKEEYSISEITDQDKKIKSIQSSNFLSTVWKKLWPIALMYIVQMIVRNI